MTIGPDLAMPAARKPAFRVEFADFYDPADDGD
jgi:hypothetical protein